MTVKQLNKQETGDTAQESFSDSEVSSDDGAIIIKTGIQSSKRAYLKAFRDFDRFKMETRGRHKEEIFNESREWLLEHPNYVEEN